MDKASGIIAYIAAWVKEVIWTFFNTKAWLDDVKKELDAMEK